MTNKVSSLCIFLTAFLRQRLQRGGQQDRAPGPGAECGGGGGHCEEHLSQENIQVIGAGGVGGQRETGIS